MRFSKLFFTVAFAGVMMASCSQNPYTGKFEMKTTNDSVSYALGVLEANQLLQMFQRTAFDTLDRKDMATMFVNAKLQDRYVEFRKKQFGDFSDKAFKYGMTHQVRFNKAYFDDMSADVLLRRVFDEQKAVQEAKEAQQGVASLEIGAKFLEENKSKDGVVTLPSGLQYIVLTEGNGEKPTASDRVKCHYHGTLIDGKVFDSSVERGEPTVFSVNGVIKGWTEALQLMPVGSKWKLFIPADLAYGNRAVSDDIPANSTLIFEVELLEIVK